MWNHIIWEISRKHKILKTSSKLKATAIHFLLQLHSGDSNTNYSFTRRRSTFHHPRPPNPNVLTSVQPATKRPRVPCRRAQAPLFHRLATATLNRRRRRMQEDPIALNIQKLPPRRHIMWVTHLVFVHSLPCNLCSGKLYILLWVVLRGMKRKECVELEFI